MAANIRPGGCMIYTGLLTPLRRRQGPLLEARTMKYLLFFLVACSYEMPSQPVLGYEFNDAACSDTVDNDQDGLIDCEDPDCLLASTPLWRTQFVLPDGRPETGLLCRDQSTTTTMVSLIAEILHVGSKWKTAASSNLRTKPVPTGWITIRTALRTAKISLSYGSLRHGMF